MCRLSAIKTNIKYCKIKNDFPVLYFSKNIIQMIHKGSTYQADEFAVEGPAVSVV